MRGREVRHTHRQADVKGQRRVPVLEIILAVEIGWLSDNPPPTVGAVHIRDVVPYRAEQLRGRSLQVDYLFMCLVLDVHTDGVSLALGTRAWSPRTAAGRRYGRKSRPGPSPTWPQDLLSDPARQAMLRNGAVLLTCANCWRCHRA